MTAELHVCLISGEKLQSVVVGPESTGLDLKRMVKERLYLERDGLSGTHRLSRLCDLLAYDAVIQDEQTIADLGLEDGGTIHVVLGEGRVRSGVYQCSHYDNYDGGSPCFCVTTSFVLCISSDGVFALARELEGDATEDQLDGFRALGSIKDGEAFVFRAEHAPPTDEGAPHRGEASGAAPPSLHLEHDAICLVAVVGRIGQSNLRTTMLMQRTGELEVSGETLLDLVIGV